MPSKFLYVQYTDLGRRSHVCLHSPESCFLRQKKFICLGGTNLACEMMIKRFISVKREKTRSDPKGASQLKAKGILKKHEKRTRPVSNEKNLGTRLRKKVLGGCYLHPTLYPLTPTLSLSSPPNMLLLEPAEHWAQGWRGARGTPQSYLPVSSRKNKGFFIYLPANYLQTEN